MMKTIISILLALNSLQSFSQVEIPQIVNASIQHSTAVKFRLFSTQNMWTFIRLNTRNGKMWQVQFDVKGDNRFVTNLSVEPLVAKEDEVNDRFTLYPTQNMFTFILLDQSDGRTWQVQWSVERQNRFIIPIE